MATICLQCGDKSWDNAFVYCIECLEVGVHRYCLDQIPETFDEFVEWICDFCKEEEPNQYPILKESSIPAQKMNNPSPKIGNPIEVPVWSLDDKIILRNYPKDAAGVFPNIAKITGQAEDKKKSWSDVAGSFERPKATSWAASSIGNMNCDATAANIQADDKWVCSLENKRKAGVTSGRNEKAAERDEYLNSHQLNGSGRSRNDKWGYNRDGKKISWNGPRDADAGFLDTAKSIRQWRDKKKSRNGPKWDDVGGSLESQEDKKKSWNGPTWDNVKCSLERLKATGLADSTTSNLNSHDPIAIDMQADDRWAHCSENQRKSKFTSGRNEKATKRGNYLISHRQNSNARSCDGRWNYKVDGKNKSWNGPTWDDVAGSLESPMPTGWEDKKESWNGVASSSGSPNATCWEDKRISWNGPTWDNVAGSLESPMATGWAPSSIGSMNSLDPTTTVIQIDDRWARTSEKERKTRVASGWNEKATEIEKFITSHQQTGNGRSYDDMWCYNMDDKKKLQNCQWDVAAGFLDTSKSIGQGGDKKKSWNGPTWVDVAGPLECMKATGWEDKKKSWNGSTWSDVAGSLERPKGENSIRSMNSLDPTTADMRNDDIWAYSLKNERKARDAEVNKWEKKAVANPEVSWRNEIVAEVNINTDELKYKQQQNKNHLGSMKAHGKIEESEGITDEKVLLLLKSTLVEFITEILKPTYKAGRISEEDHNIIVKKVVDKVTSSIRGVYVPKTAVHVDEYMSFSKLKISNLVNEYVKRFQKRELIA